MTVRASFRRIQSRERDLLRRHLLRLDRSDRHLRFCGFLSDPAVEAYCERTDWSRTIVLGCFVGGEICGAAEVVRLGSGAPAAAELALSVAKPLQDYGIGTALARRALTSARNHLIGAVHVTWVQGNGKMQRIGRKLNAKLSIAGGEVRGRIELAAPTPFSFLQEAADETEATLDGLFLGHLA